jgi:ribonuclease D
VANDDYIACIGRIALEDLSPILDIFYNPNVTIIFHAARQDLELFYLLCDRLPAPIFDTQLAATFLGYGEQIGYGNLVKQCINIDLDKAHSRPVCRRTRERINSYWRLALLTRYRIVPCSAALVINIYYAH